jgi:ABC-type enterobactin transport system permease subunit
VCTTHQLRTFCVPTPKVQAFKLLLTLSLTGVVVSSIDLLPSGRLSGGRIAQALFGRQIARRISFTTNLLLGLGGLSGSVLCLAVGFIALFFRGGEELPAKDEITPVAPWR